MSDAKRKRILLIGIGRWGAKHLHILKSMPIEQLRYQIAESNDALGNSLTSS